jgi:hypothetical protein
MPTKTKRQLKTRARRTAGRIGTGDMVRVPRAELEKLRQDTARLDWLEKHWKQEIHIKDASTGICDEVHLQLWHRRYVSSYDFDGASVRGALDQALKLAP